MGRARRSAAAVALGCAAFLGRSMRDREACADASRYVPGPPRRPRVRSAGAAGSGKSGIWRSPTRESRRLDADFGRLERYDRNRLAAAEADLRDAAATERLFDRRLLRIAFPPQAESGVARVVNRVNQARAQLATTAAASDHWRRVHAHERQLAVPTDRSSRRSRLSAASPACRPSTS
jgi:hypothetical protein